MNQDWEESLALEGEGVEDVPRPDIPIAEGEERAALREELCYLVDRLRREEESCLRQFWRLTNVLGKLQDRKERREAGVPGPPSGARSEESGGGRQEPGTRSQEAEGARQELGAAAPDGGSRRQPADLPAADPACAEPMATGSARLPIGHMKNAGATGDVIENTARPKMAEAKGPLGTGNGRLHRPH